LCLFLLGASACEPPGKPKAEEGVNTETTDFAVLFGENCAGCHGQDGKNGPGRPLNNALYMKLIPREELHKVLEYGRPGTQMPAWSKAQGGPLSEKQIDALVDGMKTRWSKGFEPGKAALPSYSVGDDKGDPNHGKQLFTKSCNLCHGPHGAIGPVTDPMYLSLVTDQMLRTSIIVGRDDMGMPNYKILNGGRPLSNQDVTDLVTYLASLRPPNTIPENAHTNESGPGTAGEPTAGNEGSGNGPGSPNQRQQEGHKFNSGQSQRGGPDAKR
jgi:cytochrome c oxidase cbb3-type subunit 3